jgi:hypothetical protein
MLKIINVDPQLRIEYDVCTLHTNSIREAIKFLAKRRWISNVEVKIRNNNEIHVEGQIFKLRRVG